MTDEVIYQEHTYELIKQSDVGFGIAISGGRDNPQVETGDPSIIISDVVSHGPAANRLQINDRVIKVNGKLTYGMSHREAVTELKKSGRRVVLTVKRKAIVRVERRDTPSPGPLHRSRSRNLDSLSYGRHRSRSRDRSPRRHHRSRSRDLDSSSRHRQRSRGRGASRSRSRGRSYSRSRSQSSRRSKNYRTPSSSSRSRSRTPPRRRSRSRGRSRSRTPPRSRHRSDSRDRSRSLTPSSRSASPVRTKHRSVGDLRSMSPLSPDPPNTVHGDDMMVFPVKPSENRAVVLKKTRWNNSYGLKLGTRIYIQDIQPGSLADKNPELKAGDTIMMINGRNVDNKTVHEAIQIIGLSKDKLTMLVKKEEGGTVSIPAARLASPTTEKRPSKPPPEDKSSSRHSSPSRSSVHSERSRKSSRSVDKPVDTLAQREPKTEKKPDKKTVGGVLVMPAGLAEAAAAQPKKNRRSVSSHSSKSSSHHSGTPEPAPRVKAVQPVYDVPPSGSDDEDHNILPANAHTVKFVKGRNVGIRLAGGNDVGIFVASVQDGSPAARQGLKMGDQILSVNDQNFRNIIREEAVLALMGLPDGQEVSIVAQPKPDVYQKILEHGTGDSFYIRTHFKYERANEHEMSFKQGSVFRISDTLYQGMVGYWLAVRIGRSNMEIERGVIPNGSRAQQLKEVQDKKIQQAKDKASQRGGIKRRLKGNQGKGKNDKPTPSNSPHFPAYERVVLREAGFKRPVVVFGPLADIARQRLASDYPPSYEIANNDGIVSGQKSNRKGIIRLNTIKDIIEKDKHAILDITPTAVEKLNYAQLYPIVVFLKPTSKAAVKELRSKLAVTEEEKRKKPGKLYDRAIKMQKGYSHVATDSIPLGAVSDDWYRKLHSTIKDQQNMPVWVSEDKLGATAEEDTEGVLVPGDDDRLSYVSAPASDYSVTTVGSEMLHSTAEYDDMDEQNDRAGKTSPLSGGALMPPGRRRKSSSSSSTSEDEEAGNKFDDDDLDDALKDEMDDGPPASKPLPPAHGGSHSPQPEAPPRGRKHTYQKDDDASSTSSEERRPAGAMATPLATMKVNENQTPPPQSRPVAPQSMPQGRFDPDSFLKSHIKRLNKVRTDDPPKPAPVSQRPPEPAAPQPSRVKEPPLAAVAAAYNRSAPPPKEPTTPEPMRSNYPTSQPYSSNRPEPTPAPGEPVYAQVNKNRNKPDQTADDRDYGGEIDSFIQSDPYRGGMPQRKDPPMADTGPRTSYNRFAGVNKPPQPQKNQFSQYGGSKPTGYRGPPSNPPPASSMDRPKSQFQQDNYKNYVSDIRQADNKPSNYNAYNPRPYGKAPDSRPGPPSGYKNGPTKDQIPSPNENNEDPQVVATARGMFDSDGGVLSSVETGVSIMIPKGAIPAGVKQEIYFKVCKDNTVLPPLDKDKGETLLSPLVMCGPHGLQFNHPVELRLPHCEPSQWQNMNMPSDSNYQVSSNSVSVLIDHF